MTPTPMNPPNPNEAAPEGLPTRQSVNLAMAVVRYLQGRCISDEELTKISTLDIAHVIGAELRPAPLPPTGEGAKEEDWINGVAAEICETLELESVLGVSPFGIPTTESAKDFIARLIRRYQPSTDPALRAAEGALQRANDIGKRFAIEGRWSEADWSEHQRVTTAALELIRAARKGGEGV